MYASLTQPVTLSVCGGRSTVTNFSGIITTMVRGNDDISNHSEREHVCWQVMASTPLRFHGTISSNNTFSNNRSACRSFAAGDGMAGLTSSLNCNTDVNRSIRCLDRVIDGYTGKLRFPA